MFTSVLKKFDEVAILMATSGSPGSTLTLYILAVTFHPLLKEFRQMKQIFLRGMLAIAVVLVGATAYAQMGAQAGGEMQGQHQRMTTDQRLQMMTRQLNLTSDQQDKIKPILEDESQQMQALRADSSLSQQDRMSKMKELREKTNSQIKPVLTSDQQTKWQQMMEKRGGKRLQPQ